MEDQLISFETAKLAKERGFDIYSINQYSIGVNPNTLYNYTKEQCEFFKDTYYASTQSLLQKWLREKHQIVIQITHKYSAIKREWKFSNNTILGERSNIWYKTYEEALEKALQEGLKLVSIDSIQKAGRTDRDSSTIEIIDINKEAQQ